MNLKAYSKFFLFAYFVSIILACRTDKSSSLKDMHIRLDKEPELLNPLNKVQPIARHVYQYIFLPLADFNPISYKLEPVLIKAIPEGLKINEGPRKGQISYTFEFLDNAVWEDGRSITAADFLFTVKAIMHPKTDAKAYRSFIKHLYDVEIDPNNAKKATIYFNKYHMIGKEIAFNFEIYPKHIYDSKSLLDKVSLSDLTDTIKFKTLATQDTNIIAFANQFNNHKFGMEIISGSGPYAFKSWVPGQQIILEKKKNYWGKNATSPYLKADADRLIFDMIPDETAAITAMKAGSIDVMSMANGPEFLKLKEDARLKNSIQFLSPRLIKHTYILLNNKDSKLTGVNTRRALAHLTDVDRYIKVFEGGMAERTIGPFNPIKRYYDKSLLPIAFDIEKAKSLLKADGWKDSDRNGILDKVIAGKKTELKLDAFASGETGKGILLLLQEAAKQAGIEINAVQKEQKIITKEHLETGKFHIFVGNVSHEVVDDDLEPSFHSKNAKLGGKNVSGFANAEIDKLIISIQSEENIVKRDEAYKQFQKIVYEQQPIIYLYVPQEKMLVSKKWNAVTSSKRPGYFANMFTYVLDFANVGVN